MRLCSIDVGIKNLAICVLNGQTYQQSHGQTGIIEFWKILDLTSKDPESKCCQYTFTRGKQAGKVCEKSASVLADDSVVYCKTHTNYAKKNHDKVKKAPGSCKAKTLTLQDICTRLVTTLDRYIPDLIDGVDEVIIELQPTFNPKMKSLSTFIFSYFVTRGVVEHNTIQKVRYISAKNKLRVYNGPFVECNLKSKYAVRKYLSIRYTEYLIRNEPQVWKDYFESKSKADDLADCFLQGLFYLKQYDYKKSN